MIILISDPNLISNSRNLSISIEGNQNFTPGHLCHAGRPQESRVESCQAPLSINPQVSTYFWSEGGGQLRWDDFLSSERESEHNTYLPKLFVYSSSSHFCYFPGPGGWMDLAMPSQGLLYIFSLWYFLMDEIIIDITYLAHRYNCLFSLGFVRSNKVLFISF